VGLAETTDEFELPNGRRMKGPFSLCPLDPGSIALIRELYDELLPHFSSRMFNVGADETWDLGQGRTKDICGQRGSGRVYLDFLLQIYREVTARGHTMQFWGDIVMKHPELIPELPRDLIALEWGYEAQHAFDTRGAAFAQSGIPFYVCPGTSTWASIAGRTENALGNLLNAATNGLVHGAIGYLNTDWGDRGHWQALPVSYLGYAAGAAYSWAVDANRELDVADAISWHAFRDRTGTMGRVAYNLGNVYRSVGMQRSNSSLLFWTLQWPKGEVNAYGVPRDGYECAATAIEEAMGPITQARMERKDADLVLREFAQTARLLNHASRRGVWAVDPSAQNGIERELSADMAEIVDEYRQVWLARNRPGGLRESVGRLERAGAEYK
jgi:hexosaminidase